MAKLTHFRKSCENIIRQNVLTTPLLIRYSIMPWWPFAAAIWRAAWKDKEDETGINPGITRIPVVFSTIKNLIYKVPSLGANMVKSSKL